MSISLDHPDLLGLADLCARRFAGAPMRARLAAQAGIELETTDAGDDRVAWGTLLEHAQAQGRVSRLVDVLARTAPDDEILREVAGLFKPTTSKWTPVRYGAMAGIVVGGLLAWMIWPSAPVGSGVATTVPGTPAAERATTATAASRNGAPAAPTVAAPTAAAPTAPTVAVPTAPVATPPAELSPPTAATTASAAPIAAKAAPEAQAPEAKPAAPTASTGPTAPSCHAGSGVAGYWYAGDHSPGAKGATIRLPSAVRVRAAYPSAENGHNAQAAIQCVLPAGTKMTLEQAPVHVAGDKWWVPYVVGSAG